MKDASSEQQEAKQTALGQLLQHTVRAKLKFAEYLDPIRSDAQAKYRQVLHDQQAQLNDLSKSLEEKLQHWSHPGSQLRLEWQRDAEEAVKVTEPNARVFAGERGFLGDLARLGHGLQRSFLVALVQELASLSGSEGPSLLLAIEEPELYQHPPQARHFAGLLEKLSTENSQVVVTTHSPYFVSGRGFEAVRMVRPGDAGASVRQYSFVELAKALGGALCEHQNPTSLMARVEPILQPSQAEMFFSNVPILVEGAEDVGFVSAHLSLMGGLDEFRRLGCHFVVGDGKTNLSRLLAIAKGLEIPAFLMFDADAKNEKNRDDNERNNSCLLRLCGVGGEEAFPAQPLWRSNLVVWPQDLAQAIAEELTSEWERAKTTARQRPELLGVRNKNAFFIAAVLEELEKVGIRSALLGNVCNHILKHAGGASGSAPAILS